MLKWTATVDTTIYDAPNSRKGIGSLAKGQRVSGNVICLGAWVQLSAGGYVLKHKLRRFRSSHQS